MHFPAGPPRSAPLPRLSLSVLDQIICTVEHPWTWNWTAARNRPLLADYLSYCTSRPAVLLPRSTPAWSSPLAWPCRPHRNSALAVSRLATSPSLTHTSTYTHDPAAPLLQSQPQTDLILVRCDETGISVVCCYSPHPVPSTRRQPYPVLSSPHPPYPPGHESRSVACVALDHYSACGSSITIRCALTAIPGCL